MGIFLTWSRPDFGYFLTSLLPTLHICTWYFCTSNFCTLGTFGNTARSYLNFAGSIRLSTSNRLSIAMNGSEPAPKKTGVQP